MIVMIVAEDQNLKKLFQLNMKKDCVIQYTHPLKAIDNIQEIKPDVLLCCAADYPRHWKLIVSELRGDRLRSESVIILLHGDSFNSAEADKAAYLGVNILLPEPLESIEDFRGLQKRLERYKVRPDTPKHPVWRPGTDNPVPFLFYHPETIQLISGHLTEISAAGGILQPDNPKTVGQLQPGTVIPEGSLKTGRGMYSVKAGVLSHSEILSLIFMEFTNGPVQDFLDEVSQQITGTFKGHL